MDHIRLRARLAPTGKATRTLAPLSWIGLVVGALALAPVRDARACGGCFHPPPQPDEQESVITDHRMAFSMSTTQTVLWDQVRYSGDPKEFAWVLPVHPGARIELAEDAFLATLDATSTPTVSEPPINCGFSSSRSSGGIGCGASASDSAGFAPAESGNYAGNSQVDVVTQEVVGPYQAVTLRSTDGQALDQWLVANGFDVPASIEPTIAAYVSEKFDFIALKLRPGAGVSAMRPVRVVTPGADPSLPLRMVAAGIGANVGIELYVISEGRYHPQNFPDATIDFNQLAWDPVAERSNYSQLAAAALAANGGRGWLTEYAGVLPLTRSDPTSFRGTYQAACAKLAPPITPTCDAGSLGSALADDASADDAGGASGAAGDASACPPAWTNACDDVDVATTGLSVNDVWVTRLRALLPAGALAAGDLRLAAAPDQGAQPNNHVAVKYTDASYSPCGATNGASSRSATGDGCTCETVPDANERTGWGWAAGAALLGAAVSGRRRKQRGRGPTSPH